MEGGGDGARGRMGLGLGAAGSFCAESPINFALENVDGFVIRGNGSPAKAGGSASSVAESTPPQSSAGFPGQGTEQRSFGTAVASPRASAQ